VEGERVNPIYAVVWGIVVLFGATAVYGLVWAIRSGQMRNFGRGALSIFDDEEPVGMVTDAFPGARVQDHETGDRS
jgi:nitrogen fixation-related uncharacterized protein